MEESETWWENNLLGDITQMPVSPSASHPKSFPDEIFALVMSFVRGIYTATASHTRG